jgi:hypothetical protein
MLNIWNLTSGIAIRIVKTFRDCAGDEFTEGTILHFERRDYLPYHSGHTVFFKEATMTLCDLDLTSAIVENRGQEYFEPYRGS